MQSRINILTFVIMIITVIGAVSIGKMQQPAAAQASTAKLKLDISTPHNRYFHLESVPFDLRLSNQTTQAIRWNGLLMFGPSLSFVARNSSGVELRLEGKNMATGLFESPQRVMQPAGTFQGNELVATIGQLTRLFPEPGSYEVRVEFTYNDLDSGQRETIVSNSVVVNIEEPHGINRQARDYLRDILEPNRTQPSREFVLLQQDFVDRFGNTAYGKYVIFELANAYLAKGEHIKAFRELVKISNVNFHYSKQVKATVAQLKAKLCPVQLIPNLPEHAPVPIPPPCNP